MHSAAIQWPITALFLLVSFLTSFAEASGLLNPVVIDIVVHWNKFIHQASTFFSFLTALLKGIFVSFDLLQSLCYICITHKTLSYIDVDKYAQAAYKDEDLEGVFFPPLKDLWAVVTFALGI